MWCYDIVIMKNIVIFLISPLLLATLILFSNLSDNDKYPILIVFALAIIFLVFIITGIITLTKKSHVSKLLCLSASLTLIYVIISILLSNAGLIDSMITLGFR